MRLYEINEALEQLLENSVDPETGEITFDIDELQALQMQRDEILEGLAISYKNYKAEAAAIKDEIETLTKRVKSDESRADQVKLFLTTQLHGEPLKTARVAISRPRTTKSAEVTDERKFWAWDGSENYVTYADPKISKKRIREALLAGEQIPGCELVENQSITIK